MDPRYKKDWSFPDREILLEKVSLSGTGGISLPANIIVHENFKLKQSGTVDLRLECSSTDGEERNFNNIKISKSGTGSTKCPLWRVKHLKIKSSGTSSLSGFFVEETCHLSASRCSKIYVTKSSNCQVLKKSVSGCAKITID